MAQSTGGHGGAETAGNLGFDPTVRISREAEKAGAQERGGGGCASPVFESGVPHTKNEPKGVADKNKKKNPKRKKTRRITALAGRKKNATRGANTKSEGGDGGNKQKN